MKKKIIYSGLAVLLFAALWAASFSIRQMRLSRTEYSVVVLGDSIMGLCRDETSVTARLSELIGEPVFNGAFGGTRMTLCEEGFEDEYSLELLNMVSLSRAIAADDFGVQQTVRTKQPVAEYFEDTIDELECIDFSKVKVLILEYGVNDYHAAAPMENAADPEDVTTYKGALRSVIRTLKKSYPQLRIVLVTPTYTWYLIQSLTCEDFDTGNGYLEQYVNAELDVAKELDVECIDLYHDFYPHDIWEEWALFTEDGLHPNEVGREIIAEVLADALK